VLFVEKRDEDGFSVPAPSPISQLKHLKVNLVSLLSVMGVIVPTVVK
jgi:hypothetical protein